MSGEFAFAVGVFLQAAARVAHSKVCTYELVRNGESITNQFSCYDQFTCCGAYCCYDYGDKNKSTPLYDLWYFWLGLLIFILIIILAGAGWYRKRNRTNVIQVNNNRLGRRQGVQTIAQTLPPPYPGYGPPPGYNTIMEQPPSYTQVISGQMTTTHTGTVAHIEMTPVGQSITRPMVPAYPALPPPPMYSSVVGNSEDIPGLRGRESAHQHSFPAAPVMRECPGESGNGDVAGADVSSANPSHGENSRSGNRRGRAISSLRRPDRVISTLDRAGGGNSAPSIVGHGAQSAGLGRRVVPVDQPSSTIRLPVDAPARHSSSHRPSAMAARTIQEQSDNGFAPVSS